MKGPAYRVEDWSNFKLLDTDRSLCNNGAEAANSALRREMGVQSHPRLCTSIRQLQKDSNYNGSKYADIRSGVDFQRNRARYEKRVEINNKRLEKAKAYKEEEANHYFSSIAPLTKLFVVD